MFYTYEQNKRGVSIVNEHIKHYVIIEAASAKEADEKAENVGIYFDGVDKEIDYPWRGDRWSRAEDPSFGSKGTKKPEIYGRSIIRFFSERINNNDLSEDVIIYHKNGKVESFSGKDLYGLY